MVPDVSFNKPLTVSGVPLPVSVRVLLPKASSLALSMVREVTLRLVDGVTVAPDIWISPKSCKLAVLSVMLWPEVPLKVVVAVPLV